MSTVYKAFFGFKRDPFAPDIATKDLLKLPGMVGVKERLDYCMDLGGVMIVTGEVGSGKSTSLRWSCSHFHPSEVCLVRIVANTGSIVELLRQLCWGLDLDPTSSSKAKLMAEVKSTVEDVASRKKQRVVVTVDEANLLRPDVLAELHTLAQFDQDSKSLMSIVLCGQSNLLDRLSLRSSAPLASRVIAKTHLSSLSREQMNDYIAHHLRIAGMRNQIFDDTAITGIHQGSGGVLRKANSLARGGLVAAAIEKQDQVKAEHIRIAASELI